MEYFTYVKEVFKVISGQNQSLFQTSYLIYNTLVFIYHSQLATLAQEITSSV
jgi:hypothetical protein